MIKEIFKKYNCVVNICDLYYKDKLGFYGEINKFW